MYRYHNLYNQMFDLNKSFILYTRAAFLAVKNPKEESLKVFNKYSKSHFSNFEYGRSLDQENVCWCFLWGTLGWLLFKEI